MNYRGDIDMLEASERSRHNRFSTRLNSGFKWMLDKSVVGGFEVKSDPFFDPRAKITQQDVVSMEDEFADCIKLWKELGLRKSFIEAVEMIPPETTFCGLIRRHDATVRKVVPQLNDGWVNGINKKIKDRGYKISCFVWSWNNLAGKANTVVMMIRFHSLTKQRK